MRIEGQGHFFTIYFPGFVCFVFYKATIYQVSVYRTIGPLVSVVSEKLIVFRSNRLFFIFYKFGFILSKFCISV